MQLNIVLFVATCIACLCAAAPRELVQVHFIHRHGARTPPFVSNTNLNWDDVVLSDSGARMAVDLGLFMRQRYIVDQPFLPAEEYDYTTVTSRSTDFERTIRTGAGVLRGLYNSTKYAVPWMWHARPNDDHLLGFYYSWPSALLRQPYLETFNVNNDANTLKVLSQAELNVTGDALGCPHICATEPTTCALLAEDVSTCRLSNGGLDPRLHALLPKYKIIQEQSNAFLYNYDKSNRYWNHTGPYGRLLADRIIANATAKLGALEKTKANKPASMTPEEEASNKVKMFHYSGHDITIYGFFDAIGAIRAGVDRVDLLVPTFAASVMMEVYSDGNISLNYALSNQTHGSSHHYKLIENMTIGCMTTDSTDTLYWAKECPLADFKRYIDTKAPAMKEDSFCYADPADINRTHCAQSDSVTGGAKPTYFMADAPNDDIFGGSVKMEAYEAKNSHCEIYRRLCPQFACKKPFFLNVSSMACVRYVYSDGEKHKARFAGESATKRGLKYFGVAVCSFFVGGVLGLVLRSFLYEKWAKKEEEALMTETET